MNRFDALVVSTYKDKASGQEKARFTNVGVAFPNQKGEGYTVILTDGIAVSGKILLMPPKQRQNGQQGRRNQGGGQQGRQQQGGVQDGYNDSHGGNNGWDN